MNRVNHIQNSNDALAIVVPVYNEQESIASVVKEWMDTLNKVEGLSTWMLYLIDDGSTDDTESILSALSTQHDEIQCVSKPNSGHGPSCIFGYQQVISMGYEWIFQIDSDGQCDPQYFSEMWHKRALAPFHIGYRTSRDDGFARTVISRTLSFVIALTTGESVKDANVPYRLMQAETLKKILEHVPSDFNLANVLVAIVAKRLLGETMMWHPIHFRDRSGGEPSVRWSKFVRVGAWMMWELFKFRATVKRLPLPRDSEQASS